MKRFLNVFLQTYKNPNLKKFLKNPTWCGAQCKVWFPPPWLETSDPLTRRLAPGESIQTQSNPNLLISTQMMCQATRDRASKAFLSSRLQLERVKFLKMCVSEGLIPFGLRLKFNLAADVNDLEFVSNIQNNLSRQSSRLLDDFYVQSQKLLRRLEDKYDNVKLELSQEVLESEYKHIIIQIKRENHYIVHQRIMKYKRKRLTLVTEKATSQPPARRNLGSRRIFGNRYFKAEDRGEEKGAPFPRNLRPHRINRPHTNPYDRHSTSSQEEDSQRDPIILTSNPHFTLSEAGRKLMGLGPKTAPTPDTPVDEKAQFEAFVKWKESFRWKWFFNKHKKPEEISHDHISQPWDEKTERSAPVAQDCPELEAFFNQCYRDLFDPALRKKITDNLSKEQRDFIKLTKTEYPSMNVRIRMEDKGKRFVIVDGDIEDQQIEEKLQNPVHYR